MPLFKPTFQPYYADPDSPAPKSCNGTYCYPVASGDIVRQQFYQTPCSGNLVEDPTFDGITLGAELVTDGDFDPCPGAWTLDGNWTCDSNQITYLGGAGVLAYQTGLGLVAGTVYQVTIVFGGTVTGSFCVNLGSGAGRISSNPITDSGSYTFVLAYNDSDDEISIEPLSAGFNGARVDNVSVKEITFTDWETSGIWALSDNDACKVEAGTGLLYNLTSDYFESGEYYKVTVQVLGYGGSGSLTVYVDDGTGVTATNAQTAITADGLYTYYITASQDGVIGFNPSSDFTGCISSPTVHRLRTDYPFQLVNAAGDSVDISSSAEYVEDKILLNVDFAALLQAGTIEDYGCYTIAITDACIVNGDDLLTDGDFDTQDYGEWQLGGGLPYQINFDGTGVEFIFEPLEGSTLISNGDFASGATDWPAIGVDWILSGGGVQHVPGNTTPLVQNITFDPLPAFPGSLFCWVSFDLSGRTAGTVHVNVNGQNSVAIATNDTGITVGFTLSAGGAMDISFVPTSVFDGTIDNIAVHQTENAWPNYPALSHVPTTQLQTGGNYNVDYDIVSSDAPGQMAMIVFLDYNNPNQGASSVGSHSHTFTNYQVGQKRLHMIANFITAQGYYKVGRIKIDDVSLYAVEPFEASFTSECLNFQVSHTDTTLITAWCDQNAFDLDFENTDYLLQMRAECRSLNPVLPKEAVVSKFSTGDASLKYAQLEKNWQFVTGYMSESALTTLAAMCSCDHFTIGDEGDMATEYVAEVEEFAPQWRAAGDYNLAPVVLNIRKKTGGMKFNRHR